MSRGINNLEENPYSVKVGHYILYQGVTYRVVSIAHSGEFNVENLSNFHTRRLSSYELFAKDDGDSIVAPTLDALKDRLQKSEKLFRSVPVSNLPKSFLERADKIISSVESVESRVATVSDRKLLTGEKYSRTEAIIQACEMLDEPISVSAFYEYAEIYKDCLGDRNQIAAQMRRNTHGKYRMSDDSQYFVKCVLDFYAKKDPPSSAEYLYKIAKTVYARTCGFWIDKKKCGKNFPENLLFELFNDKIPFDLIFNNPDKSRFLSKIKLPKRSWFYNYFRFYVRGDDKVLVARHGTDGRDLILKNFDSFVQNAQTILHHVFADHFLIDVFTVDDKDRTKVVRLWVTFLLDAFSRSVLSFYISKYSRNPSIMSVQMALYNAIWNNALQEDPEIREKWPCHGIPVNLSLDNALAHESPSIQTLARQIAQGNIFTKMTIVFRPTYAGRWGSIIEHFGLTVQNQIRQDLLGSIPANPKPQDIRSARGKACILYDDLMDYIQDVIVIYQNTPHRELNGMTPSQKWLQGAQSGAPLVPPFKDKTKYFFWREYIKSKSITDEIRMFGLHYSISNLAGEVKIGNDGKPVQYSIKYNPANISQIAVFRGDRFISLVGAKELIQADRSYLPLSITAKNLASVMAIEESGTSKDWLKHVNKYKELNEVRTEEKDKKKRDDEKSAKKQADKPAKKEKSSAKTNKSKSSSASEYRRKNFAAFTAGTAKAE